MRKIFVMLTFLAALSHALHAGLCQENKNDTVLQKLNYRQKEFYTQWLYLNEREMRTAENLNAEISAYNKNPSAMSLQRIDDLKIKIIENLQDQIRTDRDYIAFLETEISVMLDDKFAPLSFRDITEKRGEMEEGSLKEMAPVTFEEKSDRKKGTAVAPKDTVETQDSGDDLERIKKTAERLMDEVAPLRYGKDKE